MRSYRYLGFTATLAAATLLAGCMSDDRSKRPRYYNTVSIDASVLDDHWKSYASYVPHGTSRVEVRLHHLSQDADLFVTGPRKWETCDSLNRGRRSETCVFYDPTPGEWLIDVIGWDYGRTHYTLTTTLSPSRKEASLWQIDSGVLAMQADMATHETVTNDMEQARALLATLQAAKTTAATLEQGEYDFTVLRGEETLGQLGLAVERTGDQRLAHVKLAIRDQETGERQLLISRAEHPLVLADAAATPQQSIASIHLGARRLELRLGMDTGTGADMQLIAEPGPAVQEMGWQDTVDSALTLQAEE
ncbi:MAG: hypothetical protein JJU06_15235 [Ectothiorhodospiraceae bacterium]|nr:hypothetical protein [Ectothiorhodospiraceae bacterium]